MSANYSFRRDEHLKHRRRILFVRLGLIFLCIIAVISILAYASHRKEFRISSVEVSGQVLVTEQDVQSEVFSFLSGSYFWLFPKNNFLLYPKHALEDDLKNRFPRIETVQIETKNSQTLSVVLSERTPFALWCGQFDSEQVIAEHCYFLDSNSTIFAEAPYFSGDAYFKYFGMIEGPAHPIGQNFIASSTEFRELSSFVSGVRDLGLRPQYLIASSTQFDGGEFSLVIAGGGKILFTGDESLHKILENLEVILRAPALSLTATGTVPIDYIDLRFGNKVFYKLKDTK